MSKRWMEQPRCEDCGLFVAWGADNETPFGTKNYEDPEPLDPIYFCNKHARLYYKKLLEAYRNGSRWGAYIKSKAEVRAAKEAGLEWVHSGGYVDSRSERDVHYTYILKAEKHHYVPYLEWYAKHPRQFVRNTPLPEEPPAKKDKV